MWEALKMRRRCKSLFEHGRQGGVDDEEGGGGNTEGGKVLSFWCPSMMTGCGAGVQTRGNLYPHPTGCCGGAVVLAPAVHACVYPGLGWGSLSFPPCRSNPSKVGTPYGYRYKIHWMLLRTNLGEDTKTPQPESRHVGRAFLVLSSSQPAQCSSCPGRSMALSRIACSVPSAVAIQGRNTASQSVPCGHRGDTVPKTQLSDVGFRVSRAREDPPRSLSQQNLPLWAPTTEL